MEAGVGEESRHLGKNFSLLKRRSLVTFLSSHMFQIDRELGEWFEEVPHAEDGELTCNVAFVLLSRNRCRRVIGPTSTYSARLR